MDDVPASVYRSAYRTMKGRADIYVAFFEAALRQLKPHGVCAFICADRWMLNQYGAELRRFVTAGYSVEAIVEMHNANAFAHDVSAYPAITVIRRAKQGPTVVAGAEPGVEAVGSVTLSHALDTLRLGVDQPREIAGLTAARIDSWFRESDPWPRVPPQHLALLKRLEHEFEPLESEDIGTKVGIGVATGLDRVFITTDSHCVEESRLLPLAMASDVVRGALRWSGHYLINPWDAKGLVKLAEYPRLNAYYERHRQVLVQRNVAQRQPQQWYRTIDRVAHQLLRERKLYIPDIKDTITPVLDDGHTYPHHNLYYIHSTGWDIEVLGGLLLSAIGQFFVACYGVRMRGGYLRFQAQYLRRIRVPKPDEITAQQAAHLIKAFRTRDRALATRIALNIYRIPALPPNAAHG